MAVRQLRGQRITVMGLGRFGGGVGVSRFLAEQGASVLVTDAQAPEALAASVQQLADLPICYRLGEHVEKDFTQADLVVVSPAVDLRQNRYVAAARAAGVELSSEIALLLERLPDAGRVIGVTGTAGKSTTTAMIDHALQALVGESEVHVGGNLGGSLLAALPRIRATDHVVLELSSFMLEGLGDLGVSWSPGVAVMTHFAPNHLDRHGTVAAYRAAKQRIFGPSDPGTVTTEARAERSERHAVLGPGMKDLFDTGSRQVWSITPADARDPLWDQLWVPGRHNRLNAAMAAAAVQAATGMEREAVAAALRDFAGLPHRLQVVFEHNGVHYVNDSKSTTPEAARLAVDSFPPRHVHLIAGGYDKGSDLRPLAEHAAKACLSVCCVGQTGPVIAAAARAAGGEAAIEEAGDLDGAARFLLPRVRSGEVVLLSPGCASWDQFANYESRGAAFVATFLKYTEASLAGGDRRGR